MTLIEDCYRLFHSQFSKKPTRFGWIIGGKLAASGRLMSQSQLAWCVKDGIKCVITIQETPLAENWFPKGCGIDYKHFRVRDYGAPPLAQLDKVVDYIGNQIQNNKIVIVHCNGGSGRTGMILAAYSMREEQLTAHQALERVKELRGRAPRHEEQLKTLD